MGSFIVGADDNDLGGEAADLSEDSIQRAADRLRLAEGCDEDGNLRWGHPRLPPKRGVEVAGVVDVQGTGKVTVGGLAPPRDDPRRAKTAHTSSRYILSASGGW